MNTQTKFHSTFGEVKIIDSNPIITTILILATGETKKLSTKVAVLSDTPFAPVKKVKAVKRELTTEELNHLDLLYAQGKTMEAMFDESTARYRSGKSGAKSITK